MKDDRNKSEIMSKVRRDFMKSMTKQSNNLPIARNETIIKKDSLNQKNSGPHSVAARVGKLNLKK